MLYPKNQVKEDEFLLHSNQENHDFQTVLKIIEFVKEKGRITGDPAHIGVWYWDVNSKQSFSLYYCDSISDRRTSIFNDIVKIAQIKLPHKERQTVKVCIQPLSEINREVKSSWSQETYNKMPDFLIYYVNQLAIDNSETADSCFSPIRTDNRLYLARNAKDENQVMKHLFKEYKGPKEWLEPIRTQVFR